MPPKRKANLAPDEPIPVKRLRSRTLPLSTPTKNDTPGSRRELLKSSPRKAPNNPAEPAASVTINELEDISNTVPETPQEPRTPRRRTRTVPESPAEIESPLKDTKASRSNVEESTPRRSRRFTQTVEVVISVPAPKATPRRAGKRATASKIADSPQIEESPLKVDDAAEPIPKAGPPSDSGSDLIESSGIIPSLHSCFHAQKRAILKSLCDSTYESNDPESANALAAKQLSDLLDGTVSRAEGNSCLLLGPRGSGKSSMLNKCLRNIPDKAVILRLSGWVESTDRHALREIAVQLLQQTGTSLLSQDESSDLVEPPHDVEQDDDNPFLDTSNNNHGDIEHSTLSLPPSSHLHSLIPALLTLNRPVIIILDAFDLFALHPRQSLLYCLLDTVQNCRASSENQGIAVIGVTSRVDTIQLLEKRVKSRFSGRTIRTAPPSDFNDYLSVIRQSLLTSPTDSGLKKLKDWNKEWTSNVDRLLEDRDVLDVWKETYSISREIKVINRILINCVLRLSPESPYLTHKMLLSAAESQRSRPPNLHVGSLAYPSLCLLIASVHLETGGQVTFTFEMLFSIFRDQLRASTSAPVQINGGSIGMVRCTREVLMSAFESLISARIFVHATAPSVNTAKEFMKHRCVVERIVVKKLVEQSGQTNLKKWLNKAQ